MGQSKNYLIALLSVSTIATGAVAWRQYRVTAQLEAQYAKTTDALNADWQKRLADAQRRAKELADKAAAQSKAAALAKASSTADEGSALDRRDDRRGDPNARFGNFMAMLDNPEFAKLWNIQERAGLDNRYAALFKNLKLSPADLDKFKNLLVEKQSSFRDVMATARAQGLDPRQDRAAFQNLVTQANAEIDSNIQATLGSAAFDQYKQYEQTLPQRNVVNQLEQRLSYTGTPLNESQSDQLLQILAANAPAPRADVAVGRAGFGNGGRANLNDQTVSQASSFLTPDQVSALQQMQTEQQAQRQLNQLMRQGNNGNGAAATPGNTARPSAPTLGVAPAPSG